MAAVGLLGVPGRSPLPPNGAGKAVPGLRFKSDAACRKLPTLGRRFGGAKSTIDEVIAGFLNTARQLEVLRVEFAVPGRDMVDGNCGLEKLWPKYWPSPRVF